MAEGSKRHDELDELLRHSDELSKRSLRLTTGKLDGKRLRELLKTNEELVTYSQRILDIVHSDRPGR